MTAKRWGIAAGALLLLLLAALGAAAWTLSDKLEAGALAVPRQHVDDLVIGAVDGRSVTLDTTDLSDLAHGDWRQPGLWDLLSDSAYGQVREIVERRDNAVERVFSLRRGTFNAGDAVRLDADYFDGDPMTALGLDFDEVSFPSELGPLKAWHIGGRSTTWAIFVHGVGASRAEGLRILPPIIGAGLPAMVIQYRNDAGAPRSADGFYDYGETEWHDLDAAVRYAVSEGAEKIVLVGYSMGGGIAVNFLLRSEQADLVSGAILDAPMLDFGDTVDFAAELMRVPVPLVWLGKELTAYRFHFSWAARDYLAHAADLKAPLLLFHGEADRLVSIRSSEALAKARPDIVTFIPVAGATHVRSWNMNPAKYDEEVRDFLVRVVHD